MTETGPTGSKSTVRLETHALWGCRVRKKTCSMFAEMKLIDTGAGLSQQSRRNNPVGTPYRL